MTILHTKKMLKANKFICLRTNNDSSGLILENLLNKKTLSMSRVHVLVSLLKFCQTSKSTGTVENFLAKKHRMGKKEIRTFIKKLASWKVLLDPEKSRNIEKSFLLWKKYNWEEPFIFHLATKDYPFYDRVEGYNEIDYTTMKHYKETEDVPSIYKDYNVGKINLPKKRGKNSSFQNVIENHALQKHKITIDALSDILFYTFGKTGTAEFPVLGESLLKTSPSGGARHPTEAYIYVFDIDGLGKGLYHYSVRNHALEPLKLGDLDEELGNIIFSLHQAKFNPRAIIFITSLFERNMWRYREPRTFRTIFFDMGHVIQTLVLMCNSLGFDTHVSYGYKIDELQKFMGLNKNKEGVFYFVLVG